MNKKKGLWLGLLSFVCAVSFGFGLTSALVQANATTEIPTITDTCDSVDKSVNTVIADISKMRVSTTNYGFGADGKYQMSNFTPTAAVTLSTWSSGGYPYVRYNLSGQNVVVVTAYEDAKSMDLFDPVFCFVRTQENKNVQLEVYSTKIETGTNGWDKVTYTYVIDEPSNYKWIQFSSSSYDLESTTGTNERDYQCITNVEISYMEELPTPDEPVEIPTITDDCSVTSGGPFADIYRMGTGNTDYGWGTDGKYHMSYGTATVPTTPITLSTWSSGGYSYVRYALSGQNVVKVTAYEDTATMDLFNPVFCWIRTQANKNEELSVYSTSVETGTKGWSKVTYTYVIENPANYKWVQLTPSSYDIADTTDVQEHTYQRITNVEISYMEELPGKAEIDSASLTLDGTIGVNFYFAVTGELVSENTYALLTDANGVTTEASIPTAEADGTYKFSVYTVAKDIAKTVTAQLFVGDVAITEEYEYSVKAYCETVMGAAAGTYSNKLVALVTALLDYGNAADNYFNGASNEMIGDVASVTANDLADYAATQTNALPEGVTVKELSLVLESETSLKIYFTATSLDGVAITVDGVAVEAAATGRANEYCITIENIAVKELGNAYEIAIGECVIEVSALSYAYSALQYANASAGIANVVKALYLCNVAAIDYFPTV